MSAAVSPSTGGVILEQLQSDVPQSPLIEHLRNRLSVSEDVASLSFPGAERSSGPLEYLGAARDPSFCESVASAAAEIESNKFASTVVAAAEGDVTQGEGHSSPHSTENTSHDGDETKAETQSSCVSRPESYILVHNVAKRHNLGTIARSAVAFGVSEIIVVGRKDFNAFGSHGASQHMQFRHFHTLSEAALYLQAKDVDICGVEIVDGAKAVHRHPFRRSTAFVLGNEGTGLSKKEMDICSFFVYIPQCGSGTASLNVTVAASIVLHHFSVWAGFAEGNRAGQKFVVGQRPVRRMRRNVVEDPNAVKERRVQKAEGGVDDWLLCDSEENEPVDATESVDKCTIQFPRDRSSRFLSSLNKLYC